MSVENTVQTNPIETALGRQAYAMQAKDLSVYYGGRLAVRNANLDLEQGQITSIIGPSGCGKSTVLRAFNRMNEQLPNVKVTTQGEVFFRDINIYDRMIDPVEVRRRVGMVFQKPNPFPRSIYKNVAEGPKLLGIRNKKILREIVEASLIKAALWDEVKDNLYKSGLALSGGQQQRLCIARALAVDPEVILMDEPCASLDPIATRKIEELMKFLTGEGYTIAVVTHNMAQARRVSDNTAFFNIEKSFETGSEITYGRLIEFGPTAQIFDSPQHPETADYITGRFG